MKKGILMLAACLTTMTAAAQYSEDGEDFEEENYRESHTFLDNVYTGGGWKANWFLSVKGGMSAFAGNPVGHGDLFDRTKAMLNAAVGKWATPHAGGRIAFQGLQLLDADIRKTDYQNIHADFLYNLTGGFIRENEKMARWDVIPYAGAGILRNDRTGQMPFALSYGIIGRLRLADRLHLSAEVAGTTTMRDFDGQGDPNKFGDNLLQASVGLDLTIGKTGWRRVVDPIPYIFQNDILYTRLAKAREDNARLSKLHTADRLALDGLHKIMEIEGLFYKYDIDIPDDDEQKKLRPRNNYSGLNALRARLQGKGGNNDSPKTVGDISSTSAMPTGDYIQQIQEGKIYIGAPVFFFFRLGMDELTEEEQLINVRELSNVIKKYGLKARIIGAADSQTGTPEGNEQLSARRSAYIAQVMRENGVPAESIETQHKGGIDTYEPQTANRNTKILLFIK